MSLRIPCPVAGFNATDEAGEPDYWIDMPAWDEWDSTHIDRRDEAAKLLDEDGKHGSTVRSFIVGLALLDDWSLPGLNGNPDKWDFYAKPARAGIVNWINRDVLIPFAANFDVKKNYSAMSLNGQAVKTETNPENG